MKLGWNLRTCRRWKSLKLTWKWRNSKRFTISKDTCYSEASFHGKTFLELGRQSCRDLLNSNGWRVPRTRQSSTEKTVSHSLRKLCKLTNTSSMHLKTQCWRSSSKDFTIHSLQHTHTSGWEQWQVKNSLVHTSIASIWDVVVKTLWQLGFHLEISPSNKVLS